MEPTTTPKQPTSLTEARRLQAQEWIADGIARGLTITEACSTSQVSRRTFYNWLDTDEAFRRHIAYAEEEAASEMEVDLYRCAEKAMEDPRYQRSLIYYLQRRERRRERQADREHRADLLRLKQEHELHLLHAATQANTPAPDLPPPASTSPHVHTSTPPHPRLTTPVRRGANIPMHLMPTRHLYRAAPGPLKPSSPLPTHSGDGQSSALPNIQVSSNP